jgi:hypothetical protein
MSEVETAPVAAEPVSTPAPATTESAPSTSGIGKTSDQVFADFESSLEKEALDAQGEPSEEYDQNQLPKAAAPPEEKPVEEPSRYPLKEEGIEEQALPRRAREAFKDIKDPRWRKIATDAYWYAEGYRKAGMHLSDIPKYREIAPTLETLQTIDSIAKEKLEFDRLLTAGGPDAIVSIANQINQANPQVWSQLVDQLVDNLPKVSKAAYYRIGDRIAKNIEANLRRDAKALGDEDLNTAADVIAEWLGGKSSKTPDGQPAAAQLAPEVQKELEEARELKRQLEQRRFEEAQSTYQNFVNTTYETAVAEGSTPILEWVNAWGKTLPSDDARQELAGRIGNRIMQMLQASQNVNVTFERMLKNGDGSPAHQQTCARYLVNQAKALLPQVAPDELTKFKKLFGVQQAKQREDKIAAVTARRDVGTAGVASAPVNPAVSGRGKSQDQVWAEFEQARGLA